MRQSMELFATRFCAHTDKEMSIKQIEQGIFIQQLIEIVHQWPERFGVRPWGNQVFLPGSLSRCALGGGNAEW